MDGIYRGLAIAGALGVFGAGLICAVRWTKRAGNRAAAIGSALLLILGLGVAVDPPQQRIEEAREDKGKKGGESGEPPYCGPTPRASCLPWQETADCPEPGGAQPRQMVMKTVWY